MPHINTTFAVEKVVIVVENIWKKRVLNLLAVKKTLLCNEVKNRNIFRFRRYAVSGDSETLTGIAASGSVITPFFLYIMPFYQGITSGHFIP